MIQRAHVETDVSETVQQIAGLECWYVSAGAVGASFEMALGRKIAREEPLKNPTHSAEFRRFEGEANLLVWCSWRLDDLHQPLTSSDDTAESLQRELNRLVGAQVRHVAVQPPAWDMTITFSNDLTLRVFCDHLPGDPSFDGNWEVAFENTSLYVGPGAQVEIEPR